MVTDTDFKVRAAVLGADSDVYIDLLEQACVCVRERVGVWGESERWVGTEGELSRTQKKMSLTRLTRQHRFYSAKLI